MVSLNIDPRNPRGNPSPEELTALRVEMVRFTFKAGADQPWLDPTAIRFYRNHLKALARIGIRALVLLNQETLPESSITARAEDWAAYVAQFADRAAAVAKVLAPWRPAFQIWQSPDAESSAATALSEVQFGQLLQASYRAIKRIDSQLQVIAAGLVSGNPAYLASVVESLAGRFPADAVAVHPYGQRPTVDWPSPWWGAGNLSDLLTDYQQTTSLPMWLTEAGVDTLTEAEQAEYLQRLYETIKTQFSGQVEQVFWFCYSDAMASHFGLVDHDGRPKASYKALEQLTGGQTAAMTARAAAAVSLDRLHTFARYLEQRIIFGTIDQTLEQE
ncbi:MAG: glycosyl hydrolase, partial [Anaerolineae bacterium]|nr:glycosyl hydrolase [Anaerolineae bacterium]